MLMNRRLTFSYGIFVYKVGILFGACTKNWTWSTCIRINYPKGKIDIDEKLTKSYNVEDILLYDARVEVF